MLVGDLNDLALLFERLVVVEVPVWSAAVEAISIEVFNRVEAVYGDRSKLTDLTAMTQQDRTDLGFTPNDPLLRDGTLLKDAVEREHLGMEAVIGTPEIVELYHDRGYIDARNGVSVVPRPVFPIGLADADKQIEITLHEAVELLFKVI
jgi:hypothetical protein